MPHQCTTCGRTFPDGSKEMLSGCPDCGGNKFQFKPAGATADEQSPSNEQSTPNKQSVPDEQPTPNEQPTPDETRRSPSRSPDSSDSTPAPDADVDTPDNPDSTPAADEESTGTEHVHERSEENVAQASARSDVVSPDELDQASQPVDSGSGADPRGSADSEGPRPDIDELRDELNEQFESIRIVSPGKYELNLMELYERQEYIISLQEDGRYVIEMPDAWDIQDE
jgi:predicted  nucleic acid-binding Zn-ribbon protein